MLKIITFLLYFILTISVVAQTEYFTDSGTLIGFYTNNTNFEESKLLRPPYPAKLEKIRIYLGGTYVGPDTLWICNDPTDGYLPPSLFSHHLSTIASLVYQYDGKPGWREFDFSEYKIEFGGINGITVQHVIKKNGPFFGIDNKNQSQGKVDSYMNNVYVPNPNFYNIRGSSYSLTQGFYMVRAIINYINKAPNGEPIVQRIDRMVDVTKERGLVDLNGNLIKSEMASVADFDNDGWDDIVIKNHFFRNKQDGTFENVSSQIKAPNNGTVWADVDNDGFIDFFAANGWKNDRIYFGGPDLTFTEETDEVIKVDAPTVSPLWLDYDRDGLVDLFIAYGRREANGQETYYQDKLFKNLGNRKFKEVTVEAGIAKGEPTPLDCWGATVTDFNNDNYPDIFVATYRLAPDLLYKNNGDGTFTEVGASTGARGVPTYYQNYFGHGMGADWADYDNDGDLDMAVGNLSHVDDRALASNKSLILENKGEPTFKMVDRTDVMGLGFFEMNGGLVWADLNFDGWQDIVHAQYAYYAKGGGVDKYTRFYLNSGANNDFKLIDKTFEMGSLIHGAWCPVRGDFDKDGDPDILVASSNENVKLFDNQTRKMGNWVSIRLAPDPKQSDNSSGYGSSIKIFTKSKVLFRSLSGSQLNGRASQSSNSYFFGLGDEIIDSAYVVYSNYFNDLYYKIDGLDVNRIYVVGYLSEDVSYVAEEQNYIAQLNSPHNDAILGEGTVNFSWFAPIGEDMTYAIEIAEDSLFKNIIQHEILTETNYSFDPPTVTGTTYPRTYFWRVQVRNNFHEEYRNPWSDVYKFTSDISTDVEDNVVLVDDIRIYPNPASEYIDVSINSLIDNKIRISIIDLTGQIIYQSDIVSSINGNSIVRLDLSNYISGNYILKIDQNNVVKTQLIKIVK